MTSSITPSWPKLTGRQEFEFLAELVMSHSTGDHTYLSLRDVHGGTTRFANNQVIQNVNQRRGALSITVAFGRQHCPHLSRRSRISSSRRATDLSIAADLASRNERSRTGTAARLCA
ncbi:MAG: hypothetical protein E8D43_08005 [Nitrospira sp.]|nr:MAG: hypothetical protein E8D43_08005 [Nitrospira sp.]